MTTRTRKPSAPRSLDTGGRALWCAVLKDHDLDALQLVQLEEACRAKDRLDKLDAVLTGDAETWMHLAVDVQSDGSVYELRITNALGKANETANLMKQLLAAMRLPDLDSGKRPQQRSARGAYSGASTDAASTAKVSSMERARQRATQQSTG